MKAPICNHDCFHCSFDDCICDDMTADEWRESIARDRSIGEKTKEQRQKAAYYQAHKAEIAEQQAAYYQAHKAEIAAYLREYRRRKKLALLAQQIEKTAADGSDRQVAKG